MERIDRIAMNLTPYAWKAVVWSFSRLVQTIRCNTAQNSDDLWRKPGYQTNCFYARFVNDDLPIFFAYQLDQ